MNKLIYQTSPTVTFATNKFLNVPTILQYDDTPLISIVNEENLGYTTQIPIYHSDGTYLAKVNGTRIFPTAEGGKAGLEMRYPQGMTVCEMNNKPIFEISHESGDAFRMQAELYTTNGVFIKSQDSPFPEVIKSNGEGLKIGGIQMTNSVFSGCLIGIWIKSDGSCSIGCS
jgi:hypothetical protein